MCSTSRRNSYTKRRGNGWRTIGRTDFITVAFIWSWSLGASSGWPTGLGTSYEACWVCGARCSLRSRSLGSRELHLNSFTCSDIMAFITACAYLGINCFFLVFQLSKKTPIKRVIFQKAWKIQPEEKLKSTWKWEENWQDQKLQHKSCLCFLYVEIWPFWLVGKL